MTRQPSANIGALASQAPLVCMVRQALSLAEAVAFYAPS